MKYKGYNWMFWGTLLVIFNINIGSLVIFPDIVGYFIIAKGVSEVMKEEDSQAARLARWMSFGIVSCEGLNGILGYMDGDWTLLLQGLGLILGVMLLVMRYNVLEVEKELGRYNQNTYLILHTALLIGISFRMNFSFIGVIVGGLAFITECYWVMIIYELRKDAVLESRSEKEESR